MKTLALLLAGALALASFPAAARGSFHPHVSVGLGFGLPYYYGPYPYDPWFYSYGFPPYPVRIPRDDKAVANLYVYPQNGQNEDQVTRDRAECHDWAAAQSDFDPVTAKRQKVSELAEYNRAFAACMEGRDYSVG
jgi:hypothetical protein